MFSFLSPSWMCRQSVKQERMDLDYSYIGLKVRKLLIKTYYKTVLIYSAIKFVQNHISQQVSLQRAVTIYYKFTNQEGFLQLIEKQSSLDLIQQANLNIKNQLLTLNLMSVQNEYSVYLQGQLEKMAQFMLHQGKENQRYKLLEEKILQQNQKINHLTQKLRFQELYQRENIQHQNRLKQDIQSFCQVKNKVNRIEALLESQIQGWECQLNNARQRLAQNYKKSQKITTLNQTEIPLQNRSDELRREFNCQIKELEKFLLTKLKTLQSVQQTIVEQLGLQQMITSKKLVQNNLKKNMKLSASPRQTNYTEKTTSLLKDSTWTRETLVTKKDKQKNQTERQNHKQIQIRNSCIQRKINQFTPDWLEDQSQKPSQHSKQSQQNRRFRQAHQQNPTQARQRSPISVYLQRENKQSYSRNSQQGKNKECTAVYCKSFNSGISDKSMIYFDNQFLQKSLKGKRKKRHSRSISQKTNKSQKNRKSSKFQKKAKKLKNQNMKEKKSMKEAITRIKRKVKNSKQNSRGSQIKERLERSQVFSDKSKVSNSKSRSKSARKSNIKQPQYLMNCTKMH